MRSDYSYSIEIFYLSSILRLGTVDSKMVLVISLLNTKHYNVRIKGKVVQFSERSNSLSYTSVKWLLKGEPSDHPRLRSANLQIIYT